MSNPIRTPTVPITTAPNTMSVIRRADNQGVGV